MELSQLTMTLIAGMLIMFTANRAIADGTETLGVPSISIAQGSAVVAAGVGLQSMQPEDLVVDVPLNVDIKQVLLYWEGQMNANVPGDDSILVNGNPVKGALIGGPAFFYTNTYSSSFRADITSLGLVTAGANKLAISGMDFNKANNGAGILVIIDDKINTAEIGIRDGVDLAYINFPEPRKSTVKQTFSFAPASIARTADLTLFASSVNDGAPRANSIEIIVDNVTTVYSDLLKSNCGLEWDALSIPVTIPANETELSVQVFSRDDNFTGYLPASLAWITGFLSIQNQISGGGEGLTPGFWKQPHHFDWWVKYEPKDDFDTVFGVNSTFHKDLLGALELQGGKEFAMARHAVAALLNAVSPKVSYLYTELEVIKMVQDTYQNLEFNKTKKLFEKQNELGLVGDDPGLFLDIIPYRYATVSASTGGSHDLLIVSKPHFANRAYLVCGGVSGSTPGTQLPKGVLLPLNMDLFTNMVISYANSPFFSNFMGTLDSNGNAIARLNVTSVSAQHVGLTLDFAYLLFKPIQVICGWSVAVEIIP